MEINKELLFAIACGALTVPVLNLCVSHLGSKIAGALGGFPATIAASIFVIGSGEGIPAARSAAGVLPLVMGIDGVFFLTFMWLCRFGLWIAVAASIAVWILLALFPVLAGSPSIWLAIICMLVSLTFTVVVSERWLKIPSIEPPRIPLKPHQLILRMLAGGSVVVAAYILSSLKEPVIAGVVSAFPAVLVTAIIAIANHLDIAAAAAFIKAITVHSLVNASFYALAVYLLYDPLGVTLGTIVCVLLTLILQIVLYFLVEKYLS